MKNVNVFICFSLSIFLIASCSDSTSTKDNKTKSTKSVNEKIEKPVKKEILLTFEEVQAKYKKLIPVAGGFFITHSKIDSAFYCEFLIEKYKVIDSSKIHKISVIYNVPIFPGLNLNDISSEIEKWGLIDSSGRVLIPFVCDGIELDKNKFNVTILTNLHNLNTGMVRFVYVGKKFQVSPKDWKWRNGNVYHQVIEGYLPAYFHEYVIYQGHKFYI